VRTPIRHDWTRDEVAALWARPLLDLVLEAALVHREHRPRHEVQLATLLSVKTGGCREDCGYCSQSAHHDTHLPREDLLPLDRVRARAAEAKAAGSSRFCMGGAYRDAPEGPAFDRLLEMVRAVRGLGLEACMTMGMLSDEQARRLREAGLTAYNHNLDTGPEYYGQVVTTRTYQDRLDTLRRVRDAGMSVCCGAILGLGETEDDRIDLLQTLATFDPHPESMPVNRLVPVPGTPMADRAPVGALDVVRMVAVGRILLPTTRIRLSAGRSGLTEAEQALCFLAGADSIFAGDRLLTTPNVEPDRDAALLGRLGLHTAPSSEAVSS
jgi:biotin synthase